MFKNKTTSISFRMISRIVKLRVRVICLPQSSASADNPDFGFDKSDNNLASELVEYRSFSNYHNQLFIGSFSTSSDNCLVVVKTA